MKQLKPAFLSNRSHEIRTPLNGIIGFAKLIAGIGLSLCKNIVEHYGGTLSVASKVGEGTVFTVKLPLSSTKTARPV